jgi:hypothetical protein
MKKLLVVMLTLIGSIVLSEVSSAQSAISLPSLSAPEVSRQYVDGEFDSVQLEFDFTSCRLRDFSAKVRKSSGVAQVRVVDSSAGDCRGPNVSRPYSVELKGVSESEPVQLINTLASKDVDAGGNTNQPPRACLGLCPAVVCPGGGSQKSVWDAEKESCTCKCINVFRDL